MKVVQIAGLGVGIVLCASRVLAQTAASGAPPAAASAPAEAPPAPAAPAEAAAPTEAGAPAADSPAATAPKTEAPRARVLWKEPSPDDPRPADPESAEATDSAEQPAAPPTSNAAGWSLTGPHFALSIERVTSVLGWSKKITIAPVSGIGDPLDIETSGTDVSFLGAGALRSASGVPRVAFDVILDGGFSIGGAISYMTSSGKLALGCIALQEVLRTLDRSRQRLTS